MINITKTTILDREIIHIFLGRTTNQINHHINLMTTLDHFTQSNLSNITHIVENVQKNGLGDVKCNMPYLNLEFFWAVVGLYDDFLVILFNVEFSYGVFDRSPFVRSRFINENLKIHMSLSGHNHRHRLDRPCCRPLF